MAGAGTVYNIMWKSVLSDPHGCLTSEDVISTTAKALVALLQRSHTT